MEMTFGSCFTKYNTTMMAQSWRGIDCGQHRFLVENVLLERVFEREISIKVVLGFFHRFCLFPSEQICLRCVEDHGKVLVDAEHNFLGVIICSFYCSLDVSVYM